MSEPRVALRQAVKRLLAAISQETVEVTVLRQDIEVLLAVNSQRERPPMPSLHPAQR